MTRNSRWILPLLLLIGIAARLYYLHGIEASPEFRVPLIDNQWYHEHAVAWSEGRTGGELEVFRAPFYPFLLGQVYRVFGPGPYTARLFQMIVGLACILLVHAIGNRVYGRPVGLVAAGLMLLYVPLIFFENETLTAMLSLFFVLLAFLLLLRSEGGGRLSGFSAGGALGLAAATYPTALALYPFVLFWRFRGERVRFGAPLLFLALGLALPPLVVCAWNARAHGEFVLATQGGVNLYIGNNPSADGKTALVPGWREAAYDTKEYEDNVSLAAVRVAERETGKDLSPRQVDRYWRMRALGWIASEPAAAARLALRKLYFALNNEEIPNNRFLMPYVKEYAPLLHRTALGAGLFIGIGIAGLFLAGGERRGRELMIWFLVAQGALLVLFFVCSRFRLPMMPFFILLTAHAAVRLAREGRRFPMGRAVLVAVPLLIVSHTSEFGVGEPRDLAMLYFGRGYAFAETGRYDRAEEMYRASLEIDMEDPRTLVNLGTVLAKAGDLEEAEHTLRAALGHDTAYAVFVWNNLALTRLAQGDPEGALRFFEDAIAADPADADVYANMGNVLLSLGRHEEALARYDEALRRGTARSLPVRLGRALALSGLGRGAEALAEADAVARTAPAVPEPWAVLAEVAAAAGDTAKASEARGRFRALTGRDPGPGDLPFRATPR